MMDLKSLKKAVEQIADEKGIDATQVLEAIESSIAAAYKKEYRKKEEIVRCRFDLKNGELKFGQIKTVVDETTVRMPVEGEEEMEIIDEKSRRSDSSEVGTPTEASVLPR